MSYVIAAPDMLAAAAADVAGIGSSLSEANAAAATRTTGVLAAARMRCRRRSRRCSPPTVRAFRR
jgi:hypothetical protein